jgi:hypothetical protein
MPRSATELTGFGGLFGGGGFQPPPVPSYGGGGGRGFDFSGLFNRPQQAFQAPVQPNWSRIAQPTADFDFSQIGRAGPTTQIPASPWNRIGRGFDFGGEAEELGGAALRAPVRTGAEAFGVPASPWSRIGQGLAEPAEQIPGRPRARPAYERFQEIAGERPTYEQNKPGFWGKLGSLLAAGGVGYLTGDVGEAAKLGRGLWESKYNRALSDWEKRYKTAGTAAQFEREQEEAASQTALREAQTGEARARTGLAVEELEARPEERAQKAAESRADVDAKLASTGLSQARRREILDRIQNPDWDARVTNQGDLIFTSKRRPGEVINAGQVDVSESDLIRLRGAQQAGIAGMQIGAAAQRQREEIAARRELEQLKIGAGAYAGEGKPSAREEDRAIRDAWVKASQKAAPLKADIAAGRRNFGQLSKEEKRTILISDVLKHDPTTGGLAVDQNAVSRAGLTDAQVSELIGDVQEFGLQSLRERGGKK